MKFAAVRKEVSLGKTRVVVFVQFVEFTAVMTINILVAVYPEKYHLHQKNCRICSFVAAVLRYFSFTLTLPFLCNFVCHQTTS